MEYLIIAALVAGAVWLISYLMGNPQFWHVAAKYPDQAYDHFMRDSTWIVVSPDASDVDLPAERSQYSGPFTIYVPSLGGKKLHVYGLAERIEESQSNFLDSLRAQGRLPPK